MWNTDNAALLNTFIGHGDSVTCGDFTPDGSISLHLSAVFVNCCYLCHIFLHSFIYFYLIDTLGKIICTGSNDASMRIWNPKSGESTHVVRGT